MIKCSLSNKRLKISSNWRAQKRWLNFRRVELGPVGCRIGQGNEFDWLSLWVEVGHRQVGGGLSRGLGASRKGKAEPRARR